MTGQRATNSRTRTDSYDPENLGHAFAEEIERLRSQVKLSWEVERRRLSALGLVDSQQVLEPGCGPGFFTERLATWLPNSSIVALDSDPRMLDVARRLVERHGLNNRVVFIESSAEATGLPDHTFDAAISRYLFQHLRDPVGVAAEIRRVLRPGGIHVIIDVDDGLWGLSEPQYPEFSVWHQRRAAAQSRRGGNRFLGRRLGRILRAAGYDRVELDVFAYNSDDVGIGAFADQLDPDQFLPLLDQGLLTLGEYARARELYGEFLNSQDSLLLSVGFIACGETA